MNRKIKQLYKLVVRYSLFIIISVLLLFFLIREFETAYDITFNQGEVVFTVSDLLNNVNDAHLSLQYFRDYHKPEYWQNFNQKVGLALTEVDLILNGWEADGRKIQAVKYSKTRNSLNTAKIHIDNIVEKSRQFKLNSDNKLLKKKWNDIHLEFTRITSELNRAKTYIYNHFNISRQNFYNYKILSIIFSTIMLLALGFVLVAKDRQKMRDLKLLNKANNTLQEKIEQLTQTSRKLQNETQINKTILETTLNGFLLADKNGNILDVNPSYCAMTGYTKEELCKMNIRDLEEKIPKEIINDVIEEIIAKKRDRFETKHKCKDGALIDLDVSISLMNVDGEPLVAAFLNDITERKRIVEKLKKEEERYRIILNNIDEIVYQVECTNLEKLFQGNVVFVSPKTEKIIGIPTEEFYKNSSIWFENIHPDDIENIKTSTKEIIHTKGSVLRDYRVKNISTGNYHWIEDRITALFDDSNNFIGIVGVARDITKWIEAKKELEEKELRYRTLFNLAPNGIMLENKEGNIIDVNQALCKTFGYSEEELIGKNVSIFTHPENKIKLNSNIEKIMAGKILRHTLKSIRKDGEEIYIRLSETKIKLPNLEEGILSISEDITEIKKTEFALQESEKRISSIMKAAPIGLGLTKDRRLIYVNDYLTNFLGYTKNEMEGTYARKFYADEFEFEKIGRLYKEAIEKGVASDEAKLKRKDGTILDVIISLCPLDKNDLSQGSIFSVLDITERKQIENHLKFEEARYHGLFEHAPISIWEEDFSEGKKYIEILKQKGIKDFYKYFTDNPDELIKIIKSVKIIDINKETLRMLKANNKQQVLEGLEQIFNPESIETFKEEISTLAQGNSKFVGESKQINFAGEVQDIFITSTIAPGFEKDWKRVFVTVVDITENKKSIEAIKSSEANLRALIEGRQEAIWSIDRNYNFVIFNNYFKETYFQAYGIEPKKGNNALKLLSEKLKQTWKPKYDEALKGKRVHFEFNEIIKGKKHYFDVYLTPIVKDKEVSGVSIISINVDEKVEKEERLRYQAKLLDSAQDAIIASKDYVLDKNLNTVISYWNKGAEKLYGWKKEEVLGKRIRDVIKSEPIGTTFEKVMNELEKNGKWVGEVIQYDRTGNKVIALLSINAVYEDGKMVGTFGVNHNITELKEAYNKLEESQKQLQALAEYLEKIREEERTYIAREIHDDLGQTLTALKIDLSWLNKNYINKKNIPTNKIKGMIELVDQTIRSVQRISSKLRPGILDDLGLVATIEWATAEFEKRTHIKCKLNINPKNITLSENISIALFRIYQEILTNISRHANAKTVEIKIEKKKDYISLFVNDDGKGIDEKKIDDPKSLGLLGIKERVRGLGGNLEIKGESGKGTKIKIILPLMEKENEVVNS